MEISDPDTFKEICEKIKPEVQELLNKGGFFRNAVQDTISAIVLDIRDQCGEWDDNTASCVDSLLTLLNIQPDSKAPVSDNTATPPLTDSDNESGKANE